MSLIKEYLNTNITFAPAIVCFLKRGDEVLLGLRKRVSSGLGQDIVSGIGGKVGDHEEFKNESHEDALVREVQEEIGVEIKGYVEMGRVRFIWPHNPNWRQDVKIYIVSSWEGEPIETEVIKPLWFPVNDLPKSQMWEDNAYWVPKILANEKVDAVFVIGENKKIIEYVFY